MTGPDVPAQVYAALLKACDLVPVGLLPADATPDERAGWWEQHARSEEATEQACDRLHRWAIDTDEVSPAVTWAIGIAVEACRRNAERCRRDAEKARAVR